MEIYHFTFCLSVLHLCYDYDLSSVSCPHPFLYSRWDLVCTDSSHDHLLSRYACQVQMSAHPTGYGRVRDHHTFYEVMSSEILLAS